MYCDKKKYIYMRFTYKVFSIFVCHKFIRYREKCVN